MMTRRSAVWLVGTLLVGSVFSLFIPLVGGVAFLLAVPLAVVVPSLTRQRLAERTQGDTAGRLVAAAVTLTGTPSQRDHAQVDWGAALTAELTTITAPMERRRFALGAAVALLGRPQSLKSLLLAAAVAVPFGAGLLWVSRVLLVDGGLLLATFFAPIAMLFAFGFLCARSTRSLRFGLESGLFAALGTLAAVAVVIGVEAARWHDMAPGISVLDGDYVGFDSTRAAVWDAVHPIILLVHLAFWAPWPVLGAVAGTRSQGPVSPPTPNPT